MVCWTNLIILHSPFLAKLFMKYNEDIFAEGIRNVEENIFPNINIKYYIWQYKRALKPRNEIVELRFKCLN
ncbi:hypothetical protein H8356DRAFT_1364072 [Neocallimastix lanati (nom. inval.)]|nr:hypothetical protein H8356DRAFT_1364072 [Neocallimastix sp. JGI-2020a]